jgi:hypothetical protein
MSALPHRSHTIRSSLSHCFGTLATTRGTEGGLDASDIGRHYSQPDCEQLISMENLHSVRILGGKIRSVLIENAVVVE